jgi:hypothetical protein
VKNAGAGLIFGLMKLVVNDDGEGKPHILSVLDLVLNLFDCEIYCFLFFARKVVS